MKEEASGKEMAKRRGIYHAVQYYNHPVTGEPLFNDDMLSVASNHKCIKKCYYIIHDADTYKQSDIDATRARLKKEYIEKQNEFVNEDGTVSISCDAYIDREMATTYSYIKIGEVKPKHIHIVISTGKSAIDTADLALWFGIPENLIDIVPKGRGDKAFYDCLLYLTHESAQAVKDGKHRYSREDVFCFGADAIGFEEELAEYEQLMEQYGKVLTAEEAMQVDVLQGRKTPEQCAQEDPVLYAKLRSKLIQLHGDYLSKLPQPEFRLNFYVDGQGGEGKWQFIVALARSLFPEIANDDDLYFCAGGENVTFEGYHGQPVIIWDDCRSGELIRKFGGRGNLFSAFNTFPERDSKVRAHVKFAYTNLANKVNIVNSIEPWHDFLDGLAGEYTDYRGNSHKAEDKKQSYRRFPMIICLHQEDYDILMNKGFLYDTREYLQYIAYQHVRGNFARIAQVCKRNEDLKRELAGKGVQPVIEKVRCLEDHLSEQTLDDDAIREMFKDYGTYDLDAIRADKAEVTEQTEEERKRWEEEEQKKAAEEAEIARKRTVCLKNVEDAKEYLKKAETESDAGYHLMNRLGVDNATFQAEFADLRNKVQLAQQTLAVAIWRERKLYTTAEYPGTDDDKAEVAAILADVQSGLAGLFDIT